MHLVRHIPAHALTLAMICIVPLAAACGSSHASDAADSSAADSSAADTAAPEAAAPAPAAPAPSASAQPSALDPSDIDRWQKGMTAELEAVHKAREDMHNAKTSEDSLNAMFAANETSTRAAGARGAGVDESRYQYIRTTLSPLAAAMAPIELEMNVSQLPASAVEQLKKSRADAAARMSAELSPAVVEAMRPRAEELRKQDLALVAARLEAAGMAH